MGDGIKTCFSYFIGKNPVTEFNPVAKYPKIHKTVFIGAFSSIIGDVSIEKNVFLGCNVVLRADEGTPFYIGYNSNIQDGVIFHGLKNSKCYVDGNGYSIYVGSNTSIAHGALIHGPAIVGNNSFVGFNSTVFNAIVGNNCYIDTGAIITGGITIPDSKYVPMGSIINEQEEANKLKDIECDKSDFSKEVVEVNKELAKGYKLNFSEIHCSCGISFDKDDYSTFLKKD